MTYCYLDFEHTEGESDRYGKGRNWAKEGLHLLQYLYALTDGGGRALMKLSRRIELFFEKLIWNFRFFVLFPVVFGLLGMVQFFIIGTLEIIAGLSLQFDFSAPDTEVTYQIVSYVIGGIDYYLIGIVLLIFSFGIYELFISKIDVRYGHDINVIHVLQSESLEDLKSKLVRVIVVALIVSLFKRMLSLEVSQSSDFVYVALAIFLMSVSSYLLQLQHSSDPDHLPFLKKKAEKK